MQNSPLLALTDTHVRAQEMLAQLLASAKALHHSRKCNYSDYERYKRLIGALYITPAQYEVAITQLAKVLGV